MNRGAAEITADMLRTAQNPVSASTFKHAADLSSKQLDRYLPLLLSEGFLARNDTGRVRYYVTTEKGKGALAKWEAVEELLREGS